MNFLKSGSRRSNTSSFLAGHVLPTRPLTRYWPSGPLSFPGQELRHDGEDLHKHQGAVEAAECEQRLRQAEEAHPHSPSRQEAEQEWNASPGNEVYQLLGQGLGGAKPAANGSGSPRKHSGTLPPRTPPARQDSAQWLPGSFTWPKPPRPLVRLGLSSPRETLVQQSLAINSLLHVTESPWWRICEAGI